MIDDELDFPGAFPRAWALVQTGLNEGLHWGGQIYVSRNGAALAHVAFGLADKAVPMRRDSLAPWLSAGKPLTAVAALQLLARARLGLDTAVWEIIPEFAGGGRDEITVRHLLTHTAGLLAADRFYSTRSWAENVAEVCQASISPGWIPGQTAGYQISATWFLLGEIVRRLARVEFPAYLREHVFAPLDMRDTWLGMPPEAIASNRARVVRLRVVTPSGRSVPHAFFGIPESFAHCLPGASALGPIRELGRFYEAMLAGGQGANGRVLPEATVKEMTTRQRSGLVDRTFQQTIDWGLGFIVNFAQPSAEPVAYGFGPLASPQAFGHGGAQSAMGLADPTHGLVIAWHLNGQCGEPRHRRRNWDLNTAIYEDVRERD